MPTAFLFPCYSYFSLQCTCQQLFYFLVIHTLVYSVHANESVDDEGIVNEGDLREKCE